jgi:hypothetical protein
MQRLETSDDSGLQEVQPKKLKCSQCDRIPHPIPHPKDWDSLCWTYGLCSKCFKKTAMGREIGRSKQAIFREKHPGYNKQISKRFRKEHPDYDKLWYQNNHERHHDSIRKERQCSTVFLGRNSIVLVSAYRSVFQM